MHTCCACSLLYGLTPVSIKQKRPNINRNIVADQIKLVVEGEAPVLISLEEALQRAEKAEMDIVEVGMDQNIPICKMMDYGKYIYKKKKQEQKQKQAQKQKELKNLRIGASTDTHDLKVKEEAARRFLLSGHPTKILLVLRGREHVFKDLAAAKITEFAKRLEDSGKLEGDIKRQGSNFIAILNPLK